MQVWNIDGTVLHRIAPETLKSERQLQDWLENDIGLLDTRLLVIGREVPTGHGGRIDVLAIDEDGDLSMIELKRDRTPRDVIAQALDYASWVAGLDAPSIYAIADSYWRARGTSFSEEFVRRFNIAVPERLNATHQIVIVASSLDAASKRIVEYLSERHGVGINTAFFSVFRDGDRRLLAADWLMDQAEVVERTERRVRAPWSGDYYVNVGEGLHRRWVDMRRYGFVSAGHGKTFADDMRRLSPGDPVWAYQKGKGYVGYGTVTAAAVMAKDVVIDNQALLAMPLDAPQMGEHRDDPDLSEYVALVDWRTTFALDDAKTFKGIFANQHAACRLSDTRTLDFLRETFGAS
jgi:hypothetical protein